MSVGVLPLHGVVIYDFILKAIPVVLDVQKLPCVALALYRLGNKCVKVKKFSLETVDKGLKNFHSWVKKKTQKNHLTDGSEKKIATL